MLRYYERELQHVREMGAEFAREFPKIAGRLGLEGFECADPYVERLLESFAFLAARVQLKLDSEFPVFTQHMLELIYPHYLAPTPSMAVVRFIPNAREGSLSDGVLVPRDTVMRSRLGRREQTTCEYWTKHDVELWPFEIRKAQYSTVLGELNNVRLPGPRKPRAMLRLQLNTTSGMRFDQLALQRFPLFLSGADATSMRLYEQLSAATIAVVARVSNYPNATYTVIPGEGVRPIGFDDSEALLPYGPRSFQGYRLLHEYFAFASRYMFVELMDLEHAVRKCGTTELELMVVFDREEPMLEGVIDTSRVLPFCTPAINLFPRQADRVHLSDREHEYHVVPDRTRPLDLEVHSVTAVTGYGTRAESEREFVPLYSVWDQGRHEETPAYFTVQRHPRLLSGRQQQHGARSTYVGSEVFVSLVDGREGPFSHDLRQLGVQTLCTNRDLPLHMAVGQGDTDFTLQSGAPIDSARCVAGPSPPRASHAQGETAWRLISHLSLNYLSLCNTDSKQGAAAMREILALYAELGDPSTRKQVHGLRSVDSRGIVRPLFGAGPVCLVRGIEVNLECDESAFQGTGAFLLGAVLERFFTKYVAINSFTETTLKTLQRGEVMRWPMKSGQRPVL
jgi:type VI secretion system protein ImpG